MLRTLPVHGRGVLILINQRRRIDARGPACVIEVQESAVYDIHITKIGPIVTEPPVKGQAGVVSIEILTAEGPKALAMPPALAMTLAAAIVGHLRDERSLAGQTPAAPAAGEAPGDIS